MILALRKENGELLEYEPKVFPADEQFDAPLTAEQLRYLTMVRESYDRPGKMFKELCWAILEAYGLPRVEMTEGHGVLLVDFFRNSAARYRRAAERKAWEEYL